MALAASCFFFSFSCNAQFTTVPVGNTGMVVTVNTGPVQLQNLNNNPNAVNLTTVVEDARLSQVPIGFDFPYMGKSFGNSWMSENGVVTFKNPGDYTFCCNGLPIKSLNNSMFDDTIFPLWSNWSTQKGGSMYTLQNGGERTYGWYNMNESGSNNRASFELSLKQDGTFKTALSGAVVSLHQVSSGFTGDVLRGEKYQVHYGTAGTFGEKSLSWDYGKMPEIIIKPFEETPKATVEAKPLYELTPVSLASVNGINFSGFDILRSSIVKSNKDEREDREKKEELKKDEGGSSDNTLVDAKEQMDKLNVLSFNNTMVLQMYSKSLKDAPFYKDKGVYVGQKVVDNERATKALQSEGKYKEIIDKQWELK